MATFSFKSYAKPTPILFRRIGDAFLALTVALLAEPHLLGEAMTRYVTIAMICAKVLTNFFSHEPAAPPSENL